MTSRLGPVYCLGLGGFNVDDEGTWQEREGFNHVAGSTLTGQAFLINADESISTGEKSLNNIDEYLPIGRTLISKVYEKIQTAPKSLIKGDGHNQTGRK